MASYAQIFDIYSNSGSASGQGRDLEHKVVIACAIAAQTITSGNDTADPPWAVGGHAQRLKWVDRFLAAPGVVTKEIFALVLAANAGAAQSAILSASDATIQTNVNESIDALATNLP